MKKIKGSLLEVIFDACSETEYKVEQSAEFKNLVMSQELKWKEVLEADDPETIMALKADIQNINTEMLNMLLEADINMIATGAFIFED